MADVPMVLPGPNGNGIAGKIKKGKVYISGTAMEHDAGKSFADYMRLQETKDYIEDLAAREGVASHTFSHKTAEILWLYAPLARHFGKWLQPRYATLVDIFCIQLHKKPKQKTPSLSFADHMQRDVQRTQSDWFNGWVIDERCKAASRQVKEQIVSQANDEVLDTKTGWKSAEWIAYGQANKLSEDECSSAPEVIYHIDPFLAAELSLMKYLMQHEKVALEVAHSRSHELRLTFEHDSTGA